LYQANIARAGATTATAIIHRRVVMRGRIMDGL
jgi:hypothetical protein